MKSHTRSSNIELLRIVAMFLIILHHTCVHSALPQILNNKSLFIAPLLYRKLILIDLGCFLGPLGNNIFIIISGYFLVEKTNLNVLKSTKKIASQLLFACVCLIISSTLTIVLYKDFEFGSIDNLFFNDMSWYAGYYLAIIIIGKLFLNSFTHRLNQKQYLEFLLALFAIIELYFTRSIIASISEQGVTLLTGITLYLLGGYIKEFNPFQKINSLNLILIGIITIIINTLGLFNSAAYHIQDHQLHNPQELFKPAFSGFNIYSVQTILIAIILFELFRRIKIKNSKIINYIAGSTFMIYLIHDNDLFYSFWNRFNWTRDLYYSPATYITNQLIVASITFVIGFVSYIVYKGLCRIVSKKFSIQAKTAINND